MRLVNVHSLQMEEFLLEEAPAYVTLSHRWSNEEINYESFPRGGNTGSIGYKKISGLCGFVKSRSDEMYSAYGWAKPHRDISWVWVDTCCIDKRSSAELSEAINSMWNIYRSCAYCLAHLEDVQDPWSWQTFQDSKWFTRGWTLQELIAPENLVFCTAEWTPIGTKNYTEDILKSLELATGIDRSSLVSTRRAMDACVARKLSWASNRKTTRKEDRAYCLLGLLDVNMPLLYGEGEARAFLRLQEEFIRRSDDESIFAWANPSKDSQLSGMFADSIEEFKYAGSIHSIRPKDDEYIRQPYTVTNKGVHFVAEGVMIRTAHPSVHGSSAVEMKTAHPRPKYGAQFVLALNCATTGESDLLGLLVDSSSKRGQILIVLYYTDGGRWWRYHPPPHNNEHITNQWFQGAKQEGNFFVQV